jgi:hypothetical protein
MFRLIAKVYNVYTETGVVLVCNFLKNTLL